MTNPSRTPSLFLRLMAVQGIVVVLLLDILAASPTLHAWLHHHEESAIGYHADAPVQTSPHSPVEGGHHPGPAPVGDPDHHCAVTLFAAGTDVPVVVCLLLLLRLLPARCVALRPTNDRFVVSRPCYWHVPAIGPPLV
jgi:hypothetical protein